MSRYSQRPENALKRANGELGREDDLIVPSP